MHNYPLGSELSKIEFIEDLLISPDLKGQLETKL